MKKLQYLILAFLTISLVGCQDEDKIALQVENVETGAFLRTLELQSGVYDLFNIGTSEFAVVLEESDASDGAELESMDVYVSYSDADGDDDVSEVLVKNVPASEFTEGESGLPNYTLIVTAPEALSALGVTEDELAPGDQFQFRLAVNTTNGQTFTNTNSGGNLSGLFFRSPFRYNVTVGCPLPEGTFTGDYKVTLVEGSAAFGRFMEDGATVSLTATSRTVRSANFTYLPDIGGFGESLDFEFVCTDVGVIRNNTGLACTAGGITWAQGSESPAAFDIEDDSSFTLRFTDFVEDGGCGVSPYPVELLFEKI
ncbi:hypothetical protein NE848_00285 [Gramella jeungdoensis]|uniref:DUF1735 domain-containing protein n=1 Tax=Gramella jeungdoensis TaxID=708091 RepID=A0ABT0YWG1_9FLAO|nr:hypothetical protein [Gramella jeungdoensis]MCM8567800.1 hypothetical protein [Gramella jeungdoensis]